MKNTFCGSSAAGSPRSWRAFALGALALCAMACARQEPTAAELRMPIERAPAYGTIETRYVVTRGDPDQAMQRALQQMEKARVVSAGEFQYLAKAGSGSIKVRVELFVDEAAASANWRTRHRPEALAMTVPFEAGDEGWIYRDSMAGIRVGRAIFEFRTKGAAPALADFGRAYAEFAKSVLRH